MTITYTDSLYLSLSHTYLHTDTSYGSKEKEKQTKKIIIQRKEILRERESGNQEKNEILQDRKVIKRKK